MTDSAITEARPWGPLAALLRCVQIRNLLLQARLEQVKGEGTFKAAARRQARAKARWERRMKGDYQRNQFHCEGCGRVAAGRPLPDGWEGFGTSAGGGLAHWCPACIESHTMANESRPTRADAVIVAQRRGQLLKVVP